MVKGLPDCMHSPSGHCMFYLFLPFSAVNKERHFSCEDCSGNVSGGFDASSCQVGFSASCLPFYPVS